MTVPFTLGPVGHFGLAVRDPQRSTKWFMSVLRLHKEFEFEHGVGIGNDHVTIAVERQAVTGNDRPHVVSSAEHDRLAEGARALEKATRSARKHPGRRTWAYGFTIPTATVGSCLSKAESRDRIDVPCTFTIGRVHHGRNVN